MRIAKGALLLLAAVSSAAAGGATDAKARAAELAAAREAVRRDEAALTRDWLAGRREAKALDDQEKAELDAARAAGGPPDSRLKRVREIEARWEEARRAARARRELGRLAAKDHLRRSRAELERLKAPRKR